MGNTDGYTQRTRPTLAELEAILNAEPPPYAVLGPGKARLSIEELERSLMCPLPHDMGGGCVEVVKLSDLRARLGYWLDVAASGRRLVLMRKGQAMAVLAPVPEGTYIVSPDAPFEDAPPEVDPQHPPEEVGSP